MMQIKDVFRHVNITLWYDNNNLLYIGHINYSFEIMQLVYMFQNVELLLLEWYWLVGIREKLFTKLPLRSNIEDSKIQLDYKCAFMLDLMFPIYISIYQIFHQVLLSTYTSLESFLQNYLYLDYYCIMHIHIHRVANQIFVFAIFANCNLNKF